MTLPSSLTVTARINSSSVKVSKKRIRVTYNRFVLSLDIENVNPNVAAYIFYLYIRIKFWFSLEQIRTSQQNTNSENPHMSFHFPETSTNVGKSECLVAPLINFIRLSLKTILAWSRKHSAVTNGSAFNTFRSGKSPVLLNESVPYNWYGKKKKYIKAKYKITVKFYE